MFGFLRRKKKYFTEEENFLVVEAIRNAEKNTSGEVRVFVEARCSWVDALDRAAEIFFQLKMDQTKERNAVLVYVAMKDRQLAVFADEGIHIKCGNEYWTKVVAEMLNNFTTDNYAKGIADCVTKIGNALHHNFPYDSGTDRNELPDEIVFGR